MNNLIPYLIKVFVDGQVCIITGKLGTIIRHATKTASLLYPGFHSGCSCLGRIGRIHGSRYQTGTESGIHDPEKISEPLKLYQPVFCRGIAVLLSESHHVADVLPNKKIPVLAVPEIRIQGQG